MKNKTSIKALALILIIFSLLCTPVFAENDTLVYDNGALLSSSEEEFLQTRLSELSKKYDVSLVVLTAESLDGKSVEDYADDFYDYNDFNENGALCLLVFSESNAQGENKLYISTKGTCIQAFSDSDIDSYSQSVLPYLGDRDFYSVFKEFAVTADSLLADPAENSDSDKDGDYAYDDSYYNSDEYKEYERNRLIKAVLARVAIALVIGAVIGFVGVMIMKSKHTSVKMQKGAARYVKPGSMVLTKSDDIFLYRTVSVTPRPKDTDTDSGSSTHTSSSGDTHGGGGISF